MDQRGLRRWCLSMPGAIETFPFEPAVSVFKTSPNNKVFAITALTGQPLDVSIKCDPERSEELRQQYESILPGYHLNKRLWITIIMNGEVPDDLVKILIKDSYDLVKPKPPRTAKASTNG